MGALRRLSRPGRTLPRAAQDHAGCLELSCAVSGGWGGCTPPCACTGAVHPRYAPTDCAPLHDALAPHLKVLGQKRGRGKELGRVLMQGRLADSELSSSESAAALEKC